MNRYLLLTSFYLLTITLSAQIDGNLNSVGLEDFKHFKKGNVEAEEIEYNKMKARGQAKVLLHKPLFLQKGKGEWYYDADSCGITRVKAIKMAYFEEGTKVVYFGLSFNAGVQNRKAFRGMSYPVQEELNVGDTLEFRLTILADKGKRFQPLIYTSRKIKTKRGKLKNGKHMNYLGAVPVASINDQDLIINLIQIPITEENKDMNWVHIVNNEDKMEKGFVIQNDYQEGTLDIDHGFQLVQYSNDSYQLTSKAKQLLEEIAAGSDSTNCISLRGYADPSGNETYNRLLAKRRAESVQEYLLKLGVDPEQVVIEFFDILHNEKAADNRICTILVL